MKIMNIIYKNFSLRRGLLFILALAFSTEAYLQNNKCLENIFPSDGKILDKNQVVYNPSNEFVLETNVNTILKCIRHKDINRPYTNYFNRFVSKDGDFVVYIHVPPIYCRSDSFYIDSGLLNDKLHVPINTYHLTYIKNDFQENVGTDTATADEMKVQYLPVRYARKAFNADTVLTYSLKMWKKHEDRYNRCRVIMLHKKSRGCIFLYCLYNNKSDMGIMNYITKLEKIFWYREPENFIQLIP